MTLRTIRREFRELSVAFRTNAARARGNGGVGRLQQVAEMIRLRLGPGKLSPNDYYRMRVYRRDLPLVRKREFVSQRALGLSLYWYSVTHDKLIAYLLMEQEGVRVPSTFAICHPLRAWGNLLALRNADEIVRYLVHSARYPFIAKPVAGLYSRGVVLVERLDPASGLLHLAGAETTRPEQFAEDCIRPSDGTIFQEVLKPHPVIAAEISDRVCSLRLIVLVQDGVRVFRAMLKIVAGGNVVDNYWHPGNLIARLDPETGRIEQCMTGEGPDFRVVDRHPTTGRVLKGFEVPLYREAAGLACRLAPAFFGVKIQSWDIAITPEGPVPLEINFWSLFLPQLADQSGIYDRSFRDYVARSKD